MNCNCDNLIEIDRKAHYNGEFVEFNIKQLCIVCGKMWEWINWGNVE